MDKWYDKTWVVVVLCIFLFPVGLFALWKNHRAKVAVKVLVTAFVAVGALGALALPKESSPSTPSEMVVFNSPLDGSVHQAVDFIKARLKDPDSFKAYKWGSVGRIKGIGYAVSVDFGAKNSFGAMTRDTWVFDLDMNGKVTSVLDGSLKQIYP